MPLIFVMHMSKSFECESNRSKDKIMSQKCLNNPDAFCYIREKFTIVKSSLNISDFTKKLYHMYFGVKLGEHDKTSDDISVLVYKRSYSKTLDPVPVFKTKYYIFPTTPDGDVSMNSYFHPGDLTMSSYLQSASSNPEVFS